MKKENMNPELEALLKSEAQQAIQKAVRALPEDSLSLSWRSDLNERLRAVRPTPTWRARAAVLWRPILGLALASCLAVALVIKPTPVSQQTASQSGVEASMVAAYDDSATSEVVAGPGLAVHEVSDTTQKSDTSSDWSESDLNSL